MMLGLVLLAVLFLVGFINTLLHVPNNKFLVYFQSFFPSGSNIMVASDKKVTVKGINSHFNGNMNGHEVEKVVKKAKGYDEIERVFATFDKNGDGYITKQELGESLKSLGLFSSENEVGNIVEKLDVNGDGLIDIEEFREMYGGCGGGKGGDVMEEVEEGDDLREAFDVFDNDGDGLISVEELGSVLTSMGLKKGCVSIEECKEMINKVDLDGDGKVNFDEFKLMMKV